MFQTNTYLDFTWTYDMNVTNQVQTWGKSTLLKVETAGMLSCCVFVRVCCDVFACACVDMHLWLCVHLCLSVCLSMRMFSCVHLCLVNMLIFTHMCRVSPGKLKIPRFGVCVSCHFSHLIHSQLDFCMKRNKGTDHAQQPEEEQENRGTASPHSLPMNHAHG